jgi:hypothetical protein
MQSECILPTVEIHINEFCDNGEMEVVYVNTWYVVWNVPPSPKILEWTERDRQYNIPYAIGMKKE